MQSSSCPLSLCNTFMNIIECNNVFLNKIIIISCDASQTILILMLVLNNDVEFNYQKDCSNFEWRDGIEDCMILRVFPPSSFRSVNL